MSKPVVSNELLRSFCLKGPNRRQIQEPFTIGNWTYATDGHICIRVRKRKGFEINGRRVPRAEQLAWDEAPLKWTKLPKCDGAAYDECWECGGSGVDPECDDEACMECEGTKVLLNTKSIKFGGMVWSEGLLVLASSLPDVECSVNFTRELMYLRFAGGGEGLLMRRSD